MYGNFNIFNKLKIMRDVFIPVVASGTDAGNTDSSTTDPNEFSGVFSELLINYKEIIVGIFGLLTMTLIGFLIYLFVSLGNNSHNPQERKTILMRIIVCLAVLAVFGSIMLFFGLFWNALK